jgi:protein-S-isoprenylcysteine O-methyltransferase Ste14
MPRLLDYPATTSVVVIAVLTPILVFVAARFDPTGGALTISMILVLAFVGVVAVSMVFTISSDEITSAAVGGLVAAFGATVAYWLGRTKGPP